MVLKTAIIILAILGLIFVIGPFFNYAVFDFQCETSGCSDQTCSSRNIFGSREVTTCEYKPEYGCNSGCEVRERRCSFDTEFQAKCFSCVDDCVKRLNNTADGSLEECYKGCYKPEISVN